MEKKLFNLIIMDESGSMSTIRNQALAGLNETIATIKKMDQMHDNVEQFITLITFDSTHKNAIYDNTPAVRCKPLSIDQYNPCGGTPLYDTIGLGISKINAIAQESDNVLVTIITDGEENSSCEYNLKMINNIITKLKKQNWLFTFIGTDNLDVQGMAYEMGIDNHLEFQENEECTKEMFENENHARACYCESVAMERPIGMKSYFKKNKKSNKKII